MKKRRNKTICVRPRRTVNRNKKTVYDYIGLPSDVISNEPKIIITGDYLVEFYNHKGIIDISDTRIKINTKKAIYSVVGIELFICGMTDDEIEISGKIISIERE